jgi:glycosyltransferase involved in cell wall biosynthesis
MTWLTVIVPFYNEEAGARHFYDVLRQVLDATTMPYDLIFVDDGSSDKTLALLQTLAEENECITILSFARNFGHQMALTAGLDFAKGDVVITMDSDLQHPPTLIPDMLQLHQAGADIVYAIRADMEDLPPFKRWTSNLFYILLKRLTTIEVREGAADFRLMSRAAVVALQGMHETHRYLRGMVPWLGFKSDVLYYEQPPRFAGIPTYTFRKSLILALNGLFSFSKIPLNIITMLGLVMSAFALIYLVYILIIVMIGINVSGWASVLAAVLILGGVQLVSIGIVAQYIGMIFEQVKERPLYILKYQRLSRNLKEPQWSINDEAGQTISTSTRP